jgi:hypothetical protein
MGQDSKTNDGSVQINIDPICTKITAPTFEDEIFIDEDGSIKVRSRGWTFTETIGIGAYNPRGLEKLELILNEKDEHDK